MSEGTVVGVAVVLGAALVVVMVLRQQQPKALQPAQQYVPPPSPQQAAPLLQQPAPSNTQLQQSLNTLANAGLDWLGKQASGFLGGLFGSK
jgi:hypothetical protein